MVSKEARSLPPEAQEALRTTVVRAALGGSTRIEVAQVFRVTRHSVALWVKTYAEQGE